MLSWKASIFSRSELLVQAQSIPGCQSLSSFGSLALQFSFTSWLEASEAPLALHTASKKGRKRDGDKEREREKLSFMQKQPLESSMATHGPLSFYSVFFPLLLHLSPLFASFFWCASAPEVKCLSLYNVQQRIAPSDGDVESKVGEMCASEAEQSDLWCPTLLFGRKQSLAGISAEIPKTAVLFWAWRLRRIRRRFQSTPAILFCPFSLWGSLKPKLNTETRGCFIPPYRSASVFLVKLQKNSQSAVLLKSPEVRQLIYSTKQLQIITITNYFSTMIQK